MERVSIDKKQELVHACLNTFVDKGTIDLSMRDLGEALNRNAADFYYYFKNRDELVVACAEEAAVRIERDLVGEVLKDLGQPDRLITNLHARAEAVRPLMDFFITVCASKRYREAIRPVLLRLSTWYRHYTKEFAKKYNCEPAEIAPYVYILIDTMLSRLLFGHSDFAAPQLELAYNAMMGFLENRIESDQTA